MPQLRAPMIRMTRATGSSRFSISIATSIRNDCYEQKYPERVRRLPVPGARGEAVLIEVAAKLVELTGIDRVDVLRAREGALANRARVIGDTGHHLLAHLGEPLDELRLMAAVDAEQVM